MNFQLLVFVYFITTAFSSPISPYLVCKEKRWHNIFVFFAMNYIAHALTAIPVPGAKWLDHINFSSMALFVHYIGLMGAVRSVMCYFLQGRSDDLHRALAQGALLILVKTEDIAPGDLKTTSYNSRKVHGENRIPPGYALIVPYQLNHRDEMAPAFRKSKGIMLCRSTEVTSAVVAIAQVIFSSITIYRARGEQIEKYGYAAYGLSVYPYALMSVANLIKLAVCGRYPYAYVLRTATLVEAERNGHGVFKGAVGNLGESHGEDDNDSQDGDPMAVFSYPPSWLKYVSFSLLRPLGDYRGYWQVIPIIGSLILIIVAISQPVFVLLVSGFHPGQSTRSQRIWMLGWLIANVGSVVISPVVFGSINQRLRGRLYWVGNWRPLVIGYMLIFLVYAFAWGGFETVVGMVLPEICGVSLVPHV